MSELSPILTLPFIQPSQAQKHVTHNEAIQSLDVLVQLAVADRTRTAPPPAPTEGDRHIVAAGATGTWAGFDGQIAVWGNVNWQFHSPLPGWHAEVIDEALAVVHDGTNWVARITDFDNLPGVGINTTSDNTNRLAVAATATLLSHEGAGHQLKINKALDGDTASLLFQSDWTGHAEMGLAGNTDFSIKVSPDGSNWLTAMQIDDATGTITGDAIQASPTDITTGRLARADYAYSPGNLLGAVSQTGGVPTGAVVESGSNANGRYVRFASGLQICTGNLILNYVNGALLQTTWPYPAAFVAAADISTSGTINASQYLATPQLREITSPVSTSISGMSANFQLRTISGMTSFVSGDTCEIRVTTIGHWF